MLCKPALSVRPESLRDSMAGTPRIPDGRVALPHPRGQRQHARETILLSAFPASGHGLPFEERGAVLPRKPPLTESSFAVLHARCAALDAHKDTIMACVLTPGKGDEPHSAVCQFGTT